MRMLGWLVRFLRALLVWKKPDVSRAETPSNATDFPSEAAADPLEFHEVPPEVPEASAPESEEALVPISDLEREPRPLTAPALLINLPRVLAKSFDEIDIDALGLEQNDSPEPPPVQAAPCEAPSSPDASLMPPEEDDYSVACIESRLESSEAAVHSDGLVSVVPPAPQAAHHDEVATAASNEAAEPEPEVSLSELVEPTAPISNAPANLKPEHGANAESGSVSVEPSSDESADNPPPGAGPPRPPSRYRPRLRERTAGPSASSNSSLRGNAGAGSMDADLMLAFQPGGWGIALSLLLRRSDGMPEETAFRVGGEAIQAVAIDESFFEPLPFPDVASALKDGIAIESVGAPRRRWVRTGRTLHLFSEKPGIPGFASMPRAVIGQENVILCAKATSDAVLAFCKSTGAGVPAEVTGPGVVEGWRCFRGYRPKHPAAVDGAAEILLALNPLPNAVIDLSDGISISRGAWIADRPPSIRIVGVEPGENEVKIDGQPASLDGDRWTASGWNLPGQHTVRYGGLSRSYEIVDLEEGWHEWAAHSVQDFSVCGAAVSGRSRFPAMVLPGSECWLLGAEPGQVCRAVSLLYGNAIAAPFFEPVWAISPRTGRARPTPRLLKPNAAPQQPGSRLPAGPVKQWRQLVRDAPQSLAEPEADALWQLYRQTARALKPERRR